MDIRLSNNKRFKMSKNSHTFLHLRVLNVEGIGVLSSCVNKACIVLSWVNPSKEHETYIVNGLPSAYSDIEEIFHLGKYPYSYEFLNLEVLRFTSKSEPGTSNGMVVMGASKIPLPKVFNKEIIECFELVKAKANFEETKFEVVGSILLSMKLEVV